MEYNVTIDSDLEDLIPEYMENLREVPGIIRKAIGEKNSILAKQEGHKMKGHGSAYGFDFISKIGAEIEAAAKEEKLDEISGMVTQLEDYIKNLKISYSD